MLIFLGFNFILMVIGDRCKNFRSIQAFLRVQIGVFRLYFNDIVDTNGLNHLQNVTSSHIFCVRSNFFYSKQIFYENILFSFELRASHFKQCSQCKFFSPTHFSTGVKTGLARNKKENNVFS